MRRLRELLEPLGERSQAEQDARHQPDTSMLVCGSFLASLEYLNFCVGRWSMGFGYQFYLDAENRK